MAKTCRTCGFGSLVWVCEERHRGTGPGRTCDDHKPREMPLVVDELASIAQWALDWFRSHAHIPIPDWTESQKAAGLHEEHYRHLVEMRRVLACYKEEVGNA